MTKNRPEWKPYEVLRTTETDRSGAVRHRENALITEHSMEIWVDGRPVGKLVCTPAYLRELVFGYLLTENMIEGAEDVERLCICEDGTRADISLKEDRSPVRPLKALEAGASVWKPEWIFCLEDAFEEDMPLHARTGSAHGCYLMIDGEIVFRCEDIGRHNALDKVIGDALFHGRNLKKAVVYTTGRIPADMVRKALRAEIPVLVSRKKPTMNALLLAADYGQTIIGEAKKNRMTVYETSVTLCKKEEENV